MTKKIVAVMGSPNIGRNTDSMVTATVRGMREAGAEVMEVRLRDYTFRGCQSCGGCLRDGICKQNDDMQKIYPLIQYSDGLVLASPTYNYNITAEMKAFVDRLFCYYDFAGPSGWGLTYLGREFVLHSDREEERDQGSGKDTIIS